MMTLNLFYNRHHSSDLTLKKELRTTRMFSVLWIVVFGALFLCNLLTPDTIATRVNRPTQDVYEQLAASYSSSLECPCEQLSFKFETFAQLIPRLHQVCSSQFIETSWTENIFGDGDWSNTPHNEFRVRGVSYFLVLKALCYIAKQTINQAVIEFSSEKVFKGKVISKEYLRLLIEEQIYQKSTSNTIYCVSALLSGSEGIRTSQLMNLFSTNWVFAPVDDDALPYQPIQTRSVSHEANCSCRVSSLCTEPFFCR